MSGALALGWRNIWRNRRRTLISMSAIGFGLLLVIFYSGLVGGMMGDAKNQLDNGGMGHVEIFAKDFRTRRDVALAMPDVEQWRQTMKLPAGSEVGSRVLARGLATSARGNEPVQVFGVAWDDEKNLSAHLRQVKAGALPAADDEHGVLIGEQLADRLALKVGSKLRLMVQRTDAEMGADLFRVRGIFHSLAPVIGQRQVYVSQQSARTLLGMEHGAHQLLIQLPDPTQAEVVASQLKSALSPDLEVLTWGELLPVLRRMEALMDNVVFFMAAFVYFLVGLGVLNTMLMSVLERTREFGVLMALGTRPSKIIKVVLAESFWIATVSVLVGAALGSWLSWHFGQDGLQVFKGSDSFQLEGATISTLVKTRFIFSDVMKATSLVYFMALVVGIYPASRITRLQPAEALRRT
ncbi:MAG: ABC transporter permease [Archangium sp.]|nr:ABC transporter permease [Archangium sp.]